jgi:hypothetical protein
VREKRRLNRSETKGEVGEKAFFIDGKVQLLLFDLMFFEASLIFGVVFQFLAFSVFLRPGSGLDTSSFYCGCLDLLGN